MAKTGKVIAIDSTNGSISVKEGQYNNTYLYCHPYTTRAGKFMSTGASFAVDGKIKEGDSISFSYGVEGDIRFIKYIEVLPVNPNTPQKTTPIPEPTKTTPISAPQKTSPTPSPTPKEPEVKSFGEYGDKTVMIYRQHAEKLIGEFLSANPDEIVMTCAGEEMPDKLTAYVQNVSEYADMLVQNFCLVYDLKYKNNRRN